MKQPIFKGSGVAVVTPFTNDGVDFEKFGELIEFHIENKTDAIIVCGTTGEASTMHDDEHLSCIEFAVKKTAGRIPVIAGTGSNFTQHGIDLSVEAQRLGADGLLLVTPYYNKATQKGLLRHYLLHADSVSIPIILYNVPSRTGLSISVETAKELGRHPNINAIKEASGSISYAARIAAECGDSLWMYSGNDDMIVPIMSLGGIGVISVAANVIPKQVHEMAWAYLNGDTGTATGLQLSLLDLMNALFLEVNPVPVKTAMNLMGMNVGDLRMPLCEMEDNTLAALKKVLTRHGLL